MGRAAKERDFIDQDVRNLKIDLSKIRLEYGGEDPLRSLESQSQVIAHEKTTEVPKPGIPYPVSEEYPCFFSYIDVEALAAEQAPTRMILSYDGNVNSIEIAFDKKKPKSNGSINSKKGEVVTYERSSSKKVLGRNQVSKVQLLLMTGVPQIEAAKRDQILV